VLEADTNSWTLSCDVTDAAVTIKADDRTFEFKGDPNTLPPEDNPLANPMVALLTADITFALDRDGEVTNLTGLPEDTLRRLQTDAIRTPLESFMSEGAWSSILGELYGAGGGRSASEVDDQWTLESSRPLMPAIASTHGIATIASRRTLKSAGDRAQCDAVIEVTPLFHPPAPGMPAWTVKTSEASGEGTLQIDTKTGELIDSDAKWSLKATISAAEGFPQTLEMRETTTMRREKAAKAAPKPGEPDRRLPEPKMPPPRFQ
jgi:hypothetical protein